MICAGRVATTFHAALTTGARRMRPVFLTSVNDVLGLSPLLFMLSIDLINRTVAFGAPPTQ